jgi:hypothetical protein
MQGMLDQAQWDNNSLTLTGATRVVAGEPLILTIATNGHVPAESSASSGSVRVTRDGDLVKLKLISETTTDVQWSLVWKK